MYYPILLVNNARYKYLIWDSLEHNGEVNKRTHPFHRLLLGDVHGA